MREHGRNRAVLRQFGGDGQHRRHRGARLINQKQELDMNEAFSITPSRYEKHRADGERNMAAAYDLAQRYEADEAVRTRIDSGNSAEFLSDLGIDLPDNIESRIYFNTADTYHFVLPPDPNEALSDEMLAMVAGGKTGGTVGSVGTAGSFLCSTGASTVSSVGTAGSAGSAS